MTTTTDTQHWDVTDTQTGEHLSVHEIRDEVTRLDGAATDVAFLPQPPAHPERGRRPRQQHHVVPAREYAQLVGQTAFTPDRTAVHDVYAHQEVATDHLHNEAADWRDLAFWAEQEQHKALSVISDEYQAKRGAVEARYDREIGRLHAGLDDAPYWAYVQALPDYVRGNTDTVDASRSASVYTELAPENIQAGPPHRLPPPPPPPPPPDNRVDRMVEDPERYFAEARERAQQQVDRSDVEAMTEDRRRRDAHAQRQTPAPEPGRTGWKRTNWFTRAFDAIFPLKPRDPRKDGSA